jgi:hypothetical protein
MNDATREKAVAYPRVISEMIKPFEYPSMSGEKSIIGEVVEVKASGVWGDAQYPVSIHITVPPGSAVIPCMGDNLKIVVSRDDRGVGHQSGDQH